MFEYIIRKTDGEEFDIPYSRWGEVYRPNSVESIIVEGSGLVRFRLLDCAVAFYPEMPGTHIVFECKSTEQEVADRLVKEFLANAEKFTGESGQIIELQ